MTARYRPDAISHRDDSEAEGERYPSFVNGSGARSHPRHDCSAATNENQRKCPDEFRNRFFHDASPLRVRPSVPRHESLSVRAILLIMEFSAGCSHSCLRMRGSRPALKSIALACSWPCDLSTILTP